MLEAEKQSKIPQEIRDKPLTNCFVILHNFFLGGFFEFLCPVFKKGDSTI